jgi:hypothetical protein
MQGKLDEAEEVLDVVFPSGDEAAEAVHPGKESLHFPAFSIAAELAPSCVLRLRDGRSVQRSWGSHRRGR